MNTGFDPSSLIMVVTGVALLPLLLVITTSFLKLAVVLIIVRGAIGLQQAPPNMALYAIALALSVFIMAPVFSNIADMVTVMDFESIPKEQMLASALQVAEPLQAFMQRHSEPDIQLMFLESAYKLWPAELAEKTGKNDLLIVVPAFVVSELQRAFEIGFIIYVPFLVIDLMVSNILLALGMQMVAPMMVSLPLKVLLFVMVDGWSLLLNGLLLSYQ